MVDNPERKYPFESCTDCGIGRYVARILSDPALLPKGATIKEVAIQKCTPQDTTVIGIKHRMVKFEAVLTYALDGNLNTLPLQRTLFGKCRRP
jgi:hypothetical protein